MPRGEHYVYAHSIDGVVFYVGCGSHIRSKTSQPRSQAWRAIVSKRDGKFDIQILGAFRSRKRALDFEGEQIKYLRPAANFHGRSDGSDPFTRVRIDPALLKRAKRAAKGKGMLLYAFIKDAITRSVAEAEASQ